MLALITPTRGRPVALNLCRHYVHRMAERCPEPITWIVVEGEEREAGGMKAHFGSIPLSQGRALETVHIRVPSKGIYGHQSLACNVQTGLREARELGLRFVAVIEDDDWYAPDYASWVLRALADYPLVGEGRSLYYNVHSGCWRLCQNMGHASLCSTAWDDTALPNVVDQAINRCLNNEGFLDLLIWGHRGGWVAPPAPRRVVGLKGLPGIKGIGVGHQSGNLPCADADGSFLRVIIGEDSEVYRKFRGHNAFAEWEQR